MSVFSSHCIFSRVIYLNALWREAPQFLWPWRLLPRVIIIFLVLRANTETNFELQHGSWFKFQYHPFSPLLKWTYFIDIPYAFIRSYHSTVLVFVTPAHTWFYGERGRGWIQLKWRYRYTETGMLSGVINIAYPQRSLDPTTSEARLLVRARQRKTSITWDW